MKRFYVLLLFSFCLSSVSVQGQSVAREWSEAILQNIRGDFARPTVHARNLFHLSAAMYDAWAIYDDIAEPCFMGKVINGHNFVLQDFTMPTDIEAARNEAVSYAAYRLLLERFKFSPEGFFVTIRMNSLMGDLGYNPTITTTDYLTGDPAALGNYIAQQLIEFGKNDNSNEQSGYTNLYYQPTNNPMVMDFLGNPDIIDENRWQPLTLEVFKDQNCQIFPNNTPSFLSPEWGKVVPFAMTPSDLEIKQRDGQDWYIYHDPGPPPLMSSDGVGEMSDLYRWGFQMVSVWSSHLDPADDTMIDISPASIGNITDYPASFSEYDTFYNYFDGGDPSNGHAVNPKTGQPYTPQMVRRGDYARILAEFWADGPESETPPGHWFTILNYVLDQPGFERRYKGQGPILDELEYDVKAYLMLGGALHDCAVTAWGLKGYYDYIRPVSAIRFLAEKGQRTDPSLPSYDPQGFDLIPGYIELVEPGDPLALADPANIGEIKLYSWKGPDFINNPLTDVAGVGWILAKRWYPYQRPDFVTPNFAGYLSGHSTFSSAAAEMLERITGDPFFPGGMGEFVAEANEFLVFEDGPSETITLQWATYKDASEQTSLSRIWGGIHPPADDIPGRLIGTDIAIDAFNFAENLFFIDADNDGFFYFEDCDDENASVNPNGIETCNGLDDDCNLSIDDGLPVSTYYADIDGDGFGGALVVLDTCLMTPPTGYVTNSLDCNDSDLSVSPSGVETCNGIDDDCSGVIDDGIPYYDYYMDFDGDGFGDASMVMDTCLTSAPDGFVENSLDCDDDNAQIYPGAPEVSDNGIDEDCSGVDYYQETKLYPNPVQGMLTIHFETANASEEFAIYGVDGKLLQSRTVSFINNEGFLDVSTLSAGVYYLRMFSAEDEQTLIHKMIVF